MRFITDGMLGKLTRWLRLAGQDVVYIRDQSIDSENEDMSLLKLARKYSRTLITRDIDLHRIASQRGIKSILIKDTDDVAKQLVKISKSTKGPIKIDIEKSRCSVCNGELEAVVSSSVSDEVPDSVLENQKQFWRCKKCGKIYWHGGHWENIGKTFRRFEKLKG